jgi:hypothetical protein
VTTRKYTQQARAAAADETRRRILDAMRDRLRAAPSEALSIERVAQEAALGQDLLERTGFQRIVDAVALPDARDAVRESLRAAAGVYASERDVSRTIYSMWSLEPEAVRRAFEVVERGRAEGQSWLARRLAEEGHLHRDVTVEEATDILWAITSFETFDQLYTGRGLSEEDTAARLVTMAERTLWAPRG